MSGKLKRYDENKKLECMIEVENGMAIRAVAKKHNVHPSNVYRWAEEVGLHKRTPHNTGSRHKYTRDFKRKALAAAQETPPTEMKNLADRLEMPVSTLRKWVNRYRKKRPRTSNVPALESSGSFAIVPTVPTVPTVPNSVKNEDEEPLILSAVRILCRLQSRDRKHVLATVAALVESQK